MAQSKPEYETLKEFRGIAEQVVQKFPDMFDGLDIKTVTCVAITNKEPKEDDKEKFEIKPVPYPIRLDCAYDYYVVVNKTTWDSFDEAHKAVLVMKALCRLSTEGDQKVVPYDLKDVAVMVRTLGVDYLDKPNIPNILKDDVKWKLI